jgi:hypothetical protein
MLTDNVDTQPTALLNILTALINVIFAHGQSLLSWRKAIISMIPKKNEDGSSSKFISDMRPISVLQEFGKLASKILANRIGLILLDNPNIMSAAQRAFLKDGSTSQCLHTAINILEDFKESHKSDSKKQLFILAYDQSKAFDSVQSYTIKASLERFNLPASFIEYALSNLENASSCFKTFFGPTKDIPVRTSVRQGDPLSPLIYIFITDALHEGLHTSPLYAQCRTGYTFSNDPSLCVSSTGYADDTLTYAGSWLQQWQMHEWVRDFCSVHHFKLNAMKCKYIISDCSGSEDPRWLLSVDGSEKITPLSSSKQFRYLGLWISMDLNWTSQIQILNKLIMDWRWRSAAAKTDAAQLKTSVIDYLLPKMELGLSFATITQKMCDAWLSTIMHTLCRGFSTVTTLNRDAFCILANIPDIFKRMQTLRVMDLIVNLNSRSGAHGTTTRARFCRLMGHKTQNFEVAIRELEHRRKFNSRAGIRMAGSIQYLQRADVTLAWGAGQGSNDPLILVSSLHKQMADSPSEHFFVYTDGSTTPSTKTVNSGCSTILMNAQHSLLFKGGMVVRSDGNNFTSELAAAACAIQALPDNKSLTLRSDSLATIGALKNARVSERKRVRAPGRAWLNFCRLNLLSKSSKIHLEHISSHKGTESAAQKGNDTADKVANEFRVRGEGKSSSPVPYFSVTEECVVVKFNGKVIQNDPRKFLKALEREQMIETWKKKAPKQFLWFSCHPKQILLQSRKIWEDSIKSGDGGMWLYFIFAVCQWLPTNHRVFYGNKSERHPEYCQLCLQSGTEDIRHDAHLPCSGSS